MYGRYERLTRQELYELVWSVPASKLSERFQLSGRGLGKLCERHGIPVPERGWWAKKAAGHAVKTPPLPPLEDPYLERIEIYVREDFRQWLSPEEHAFFEQRLAEEATALPPTVPDADDSRHPLIVRSRRKQPEGTTALHIKIAVSAPIRDRALRLATAFVAACEARKYTFAPWSEKEPGIVAVNVFGHLIGFAIEEPPRKAPHVLTKAEEREKAVGRGWNIPEYDSVPGGEIVITLHHSADNERRSFAGGKDREIETTLPDVMKALVRIATRLRAHDNYLEEKVRRDREAADQRRLEDQRRREEEARIAAERRRKRELVHDAARFRQAHSLMQLIGAVEEVARSERVNEAAFQEWLIFATALAESLNPVPRLLKPLLHVAREP